MTITAPQPVETSTQSPLGEAVPIDASSPSHRRRSTAAAGRTSRPTAAATGRSGSSSILFVVSLFAEFDRQRPAALLIKYDGHLYWPAFVSYSETTFGGDFETAADYRDPYLQKQIAEKGGTIIWPPIRYSYATHNLDLPTPAPSPPTWMLTEAQCKEVVQKKGLNELPRPRIQLARHRRPGPRRGRAPDLRLPHLGAVRADADRSSPRSSASRPAACRAISAAGSTCSFQRFIEIWNAIPALICS